ncbi:MAG: nitrite reductase large subunit NirB [Acidimicrobiales bacterium]
MELNRPRRKLVVVGHGMVGNKVVEALVRRGATRTWDVVVIGEESRPAYDRVHLSRLFEGAGPTDLALGDLDLESHPAITLLTGERAVGINRQEHTVLVDSGRVVDYDLVVLATGSTPYVPPVPGRELPGCFVYRTIDDVDAIRAWAVGRGHGVVVGGGLLGLEAANALRSCGLTTEVVEYAPHLMPAQVDAAGGDLLRRRIEALGVVVHTATTVAGVSVGADGVLDGVNLALSGEPAATERLTTELVVFAAGIRPRDDLARDCGLEVGPRGGVAVDEHCRTGDPLIYAVGECALVNGRIHGLVAPGYQMARVVAEIICGGEAVFAGGDTPTKLKLLGVDVASFGDAHAQGSGAATITFTDNVAMVHRRLVIDEHGTVAGGVLVGDTTGFEAMVAMAGGDAPTPATPARLLVPGDLSGFAFDPVGGAASLTRSATICSCENVSKSVICDAIAACITATGTADVAGVKAATGAGTGCGGCIPQLAELVQAELIDRGIEVTDRLCEHFAYSRRQLFDIVRVEQITTFAELVSRHGTGRGCEVCKPTIASILASQGGGYVLDGEGAALQDTNDHFLANLQRDGTYSVVPRVPGGEITPTKLIVLGEVARDFGLYVKITGGQRVDLLGARVEALPAIWARLVDAGFESGHAYGKAVRTVKSCVGTNWCRFGVQDSTTLAIDLELRYRGLRSPHKVKMAVSGCARECAEAQSKDIGVIATERGWNLYVGGNGGTRPRHAEMLAEDLDRDTLLRTVDRVLMFYIRTADRLQRTATWLEGLDGGVAYLRSVVFDDALGVAAELDRDMARHVDGYRCEWTETLKDPVGLRRFRTFVNSERPDPDIIVVQERSQPRPATEWDRVRLTVSRK